MSYGKFKMGKGPRKPDASDAFVYDEKRKKHPKPGRPGFVPTPRVPGGPRPLPRSPKKRGM